MSSLSVIAIPLLRRTRSRSLQQYLRKNSSSSFQFNNTSSSYLCTLPSPCPCPCPYRLSTLRTMTIPSTITSSSTLIQRNFSVDKNQKEELSTEYTRFLKRSNNAKRFEEMKELAASFFHKQQSKPTSSRALNHNDNNTSTIAATTSANNMNLICDPSPYQLRDALKIMQYFHNHSARNITLNLPPAESDPIHVNSSLEDPTNASNMITYYSGAQLCDHILRTIVPFSHMTVPVDERDFPTSIIRMHILTIQAYASLTKSASSLSATIGKNSENGSNGVEERLQILLEAPQMAEAVLRNLMSTRLMFPETMTPSPPPPPPARTENSKKKEFDPNTAMDEYMSSLKIAFNSTLEAYAKCGGGVDSAQRAEDLLTRMKTLYNQKYNAKIGNNPQQLSHIPDPSTLLSCCPPDTISFNTVIYAWSQIYNQIASRKKPDASMGKLAAERAESILNHMSELESKGSALNIAPNLVTVNTVLHTWSRSRTREAPFRAQKILDNMIEGHLKGSTGFFPNVYTFSTVINSWAQSKRPDAAPKAMELLAQMEKFHEEWYDNVQPNAIVLNSVLNAWAKHQNPCEVYRQLGPLMDKLESVQALSTENAMDTSTVFSTEENGMNQLGNHIVDSPSMNKSKIRPNSITYGIAILMTEKCAVMYSKNPKKWGKLKRENRIEIDVDLANKAEQYAQCLLELDRIENEKSNMNTNSDFDSSSNTSQNNTTFYLNRAINALMQTEVHDSPERVQRLLKSAIDHSYIQPDQFTYARVIRAFASTSDKNDIDKAYKILTDMENDYKEGKINIQPDIFCYHNVLHAFCSNQQISDAEKLLLHMENLCEEGDENHQKKINVRPERLSYVALMLAYMQRFNSMSLEDQKKDTETIHNIESILERMVTLNKKYPKEVYVNTLVLNIVLNAYALSFREDRAKKALDLLQQMQTMSESKENTNVKPDLKTYTTVIHALKDYEHAAEMTQNILERIETQGDVVLFNTVLTTLASSDVEKAEEYLNRLEDGQINLNNLQCRPLISAYIEQNSIEGIEKAEAMLQKMVNWYYDKKSNLYPNAALFTDVITAVGSSGSEDAANKVETLITKMDEAHSRGMNNIRPDAAVFNALLRALEHDRAGERAEQILNHMEALCKEGNRRVEPNKTSYKRVFNAWIRSEKEDSAERIHDFFKRLIVKYPNLLVLTDFHAIMLKCGYSNHPNAVNFVSEILSHLENETNRKPTQYTYTILLRACQHAALTMQESGQAKKERDSKIFEISRDTFKKIIESPEYKKDDAPFALFLKCCMELLPDDDQRGTQPSSRERVVTALFQKTCAEGLVSERVLSKLFTDKDLAYKLTGRGDESYSKKMMEQLPSSWSSNVPE